MEDERLNPDEFESWDGEDISEDNEEEDAASTSAVKVSLDGYTFDTLVGFDDEIARIRELGIIDGEDEEFVLFVEQMKIQHGLPRESSGTTVVFRSDVRDDADRLMVATANELDRATIRIRMLPGPMGSQALCVMSTPGVTIEGFQDWGTLVLEGIDSWGTADAMMPGAMAAGAMSRDSASAAMKTVAFIRGAIADPKVAVFVSASGEIEPDSPLGMFLGPTTVLEIPAPSQSERDDIWNYLMDKHVSMSALDRYELVELSRGMPRCDIFAAAREAVVQAYRQSLERKAYVPVTRAALLEKIAAYQPLDSAEYRFIEDSVVEDFLLDLERYERGEL